MKIILAVIFILSTTCLFAQDVDSTKNVILTTVNLDYEILDSNSIKDIVKSSNYFKIYRVNDDTENGYSNKLAYYSTHKNKWISFYLPFTNPIVKPINLDNKGKDELIIYGSIPELGAHASGETDAILIVNIDSIPTQIFFIYYDYSLDLFDPAGQLESKKIHCGRQVKLVKRKIIIGKLDNTNGCETLTKIREGTYIMVDGKIKRKK